MAEELGVEVSEVVEGGTALAFIAYPTAVTKEDITHASIKVYWMETFGLLSYFFNSF